MFGSTIGVNSSLPFHHLGEYLPTKQQGLSSVSRASLISQLRGALGAGGSHEPIPSRNCSSAGPSGRWGIAASAWAPLPTRLSHLSFPLWSWASAAKKGFGGALSCLQKLREESCAGMALRGRVTRVKSEPGDRKLP